MVSLHLSIANVIVIKNKCTFYYNIYLLCLVYIYTHIFNIYLLHYNISYILISTMLLFLFSIL